MAGNIDAKSEMVEPAALTRFISLKREIISQIYNTCAYPSSS